MRVINDVHIGAIRSAGTTPFTQLELRKTIRAQFKALLPVGENLLLLGDLFDVGAVPLVDVIETYAILDEWLKANPTSRLYNAAGNHDLNKTSNVLSSFQFLGRLLSRQHPGRYIHIEEPTLTDYGYIIPHLVNQDMFNAALEAVPQCNFLFLHCNYNNGFAAQADQSLNLSEEQALKLPAKHIVIAHEHHGRESGKVLIPGNQIASSVSDWLNPRDKRYITVTADGNYRFTICNRRNTEYAEVTWDNIEQVPDAKFVRFVGDATAEQATAVVNAVNAFRKSSDALVVTNAVNIQTEDSEVTNFEESLESVQGFSVMTALKEFLTEEEFKVLEGLCS